MDGRLPSHMLVTALLRRMNDSGGMGMVLAKGDPQGGGILVIVIDADRRERVLERGIGPDGRTALIESTPANDILSYWQRRRARDPDLWVIELDGAAAERFTAETILQH
ncbi:MULTISPECIES: DUF1491 family protein [Sphingomonas]|jgi:hypothetical protein|uniref:DUF1491 family protein n=1 Tax=Sphingomonas zeae TaxID=1646122 RepID=A0A7Y6B2X9_9SPHN|nr:MULTISPECIES: DUF1491 family protein [Sphingomonas]MBB4049000.1 hypothetical protein [Sphingomonas zeae]MDK8187330.1 DUF1491 family protein [Sphingomonas zeae]MDK8217072.1 DUF1491 family protein [Sphingomonas sp. UMB7805-LC452B]NUU46467.1 DUF1491 family protein [Sphingomonas zeae]